jgi:hypothetical protein
MSLRHLIKESAGTVDGCLRPPSFHELSFWNVQAFMSLFKSSHLQIAFGITDLQGQGDSNQLP